ncbi:hypothetical protein [Rhizobium sp. G21]|uniref:hypothetical protein n=1 Tax=Rhizobium sp. G21 TaxID=2758439 RepID=UPI0015FEF7C2|nr:hypothetical protein [Rhizobium sp. G21]MBB1250118.1 hypothetical protein [Rhizobium sp. G21]
MSDKDPFLMIGLHRLAAERGDGFAPELLQLLLERGRRDLQAARPMDLDVADDPMQHGSDAKAPGCGNDNVVAFPVRAKRNPGR